MLQRHTFQKLHGNERLLAVFADFINGANIRMIESRRRTGFPAKTLQWLRVVRQFIGQEFQGHETAKLGVFSFVNNTHAATTELLDDAVVRDGLVNHKEMPVFRSLHLTDAAFTRQRMTALAAACRTQNTWFRTV